MNEVVVSGLSDLQKLLNTLPAKIEKNVMRGALRAGMKPVAIDARANAPKDTGLMAKDLKISTRASRGEITVKLKATGKHAHIAHFAEYGVKPHKIGGGMHPGYDGNPFMRPALDQNAAEVLVAAGNYIKNRLSTKHGLDTSDITIGDEE
jgi:HK97 gp10 family phage protein